jgi:choline-sulfatase
MKVMTKFVVPRGLGLGLVIALACGVGCGRGQPPQASRPSILLVTLDTTRADAIGPDARGVTTPAFNALAARGRRFTQAYATVPETLPSHSSMMTGLYAAGHGVHENARALPAAHPVIAERLKQAGYRTAAFVSSFILTKRFGLARGFETYDDELTDRGVERSAAQTTDRALTFLDQQAAQTGPAAGGSRPPLFVWVHYFDPHTPYAPPEPFKSQYASQPYLGEVAAMDAQLGRLVQAFDQRAPGPTAIVVVADHGEGLGEHGEAQHGHLLYQTTMHVPLVIVGPGMASGASDAPVSTRRLFHTLLDLAGQGSERSLRADTKAAEPDVVLGEAMKPFLEYGWQPQIMALDGRLKVIQTRRPEVYDVIADARESSDLSASARLSAHVTKALDEYPVPTPGEATRAPDTLGDEARKQLASLGYVSATAPPVIRKDAPRPADMTGVLDTIERASTLFVQEQYAQVIPLLQKILEADPHNLDAALRLATAYSILGDDDRARVAFGNASAIAPDSSDVRAYLALHYARGKQWLTAVPLLAKIEGETPDRLPVVEALAELREKLGEFGEAVRLREHAYTLREPSAAELVRLGQLAMQAHQEPSAIAAFERARTLQGQAFTHDLELGVIYLAARRVEDARTALDRVPPTHPDYPMALFKRAQVSVLLREPDRQERIERARQRADATTRPLIARERLFQNAPGQ